MRKGRGGGDGAAAMDAAESSRHLFSVARRSVCPHFTPPSLSRLSNCCQEGRKHPALNQRPTLSSPYSPACGTSRRTTMSTYYAGSYYALETRSPCFLATHSSIESLALLPSDIRNIIVLTGHRPTRLHLLRRRTGAIESVQYHVENHGLSHSLTLVSLPAERIRTKNRDSGSTSFSIYLMEQQRGLEGLSVPSSSVCLPTDTYCTTRPAGVTGPDPPPPPHSFLFPSHPADPRYF